MPRRGRRRTIARNCYEDATGRSVVYRLAGQRHEIRHPPKTPVLEMRKAVRQKLTQASIDGTAEAPVRGTLSHAVLRWLPLERGLVSWKQRKAELKAWARELGPKRMSAITPLDVRTVISRWAAAGVSPKTIRNRLWSLQHLYRVLFGPHTHTPADEVPKPPKPRTVPTAVPLETIGKVYATLYAMEQSGRLRNAKTRARFMVRATTGRRPSEIMRALPGDVDLEARTWRVRDGKGGWSEGLYLNDDAKAAWQVFSEAEAWGKFDTQSMAEVLRIAGWPVGVRPYELRHTIGIALSDAGIDLADISAWLGHTRVQTTRSIYVPILKGRMQRAAEAIEGRHHWESVAPEVAPPRKPRQRKT